MTALSLAMLLGCGRLGYGVLDEGADAGADSGAQPIDPVRERLISGWYHTCRVSGTAIHCWGDGREDEFGTGVAEIAPSPIELPIMAGTTRPFHHLTAGDDHTCGLLDGNAYCWGHGKLGQLGDGNTGERDTPTRVVDLPDGQVTALDAGYSLTCAIADDRVYCWGDNDAGQLGIGTFESSPRPLPVQGIAGTPVDIDAGEDHACALTQDGAVYCWGHDDGGALGVGQNVGSSTMALPSLISDVDLVSIASVHTCALANGAVSCWGTGDRGELGNGSFDNSNTPVPVTGLGDSVTDIFTAAGPDSDDASCAIRDGIVHCWGSNTTGRLGDGTTDTPSEPVEVWLPAPAVDIAGGATHSCALLDDDTVWCWGAGERGQLGDGAMSDSLTPVQVALP